MSFVCVFSSVFFCCAWLGYLVFCKRGIVGKRGFGEQLEFCFGEGPVFLLSPSFCYACSDQKKLKTASSSSPATAIRKIDRSAMGVAYASGSRQTAQKQRRPLPRRGQVKAAIAASWLHTLASIVHGARSVALSHSHSGWSFRSN